MAKTNDKALALRRRKKSIRKNVHGTDDRPRVAVYRSAKHIYAQVIDDLAGRTVVSASTLCKELRESHPNGGNREAAEAVGKLLAARAKEAGISQVVFDRGGFLYHGRVAALADGARAGGLEF